MEKACVQAPKGPLVQNDVPSKNGLVSFKREDIIGHDDDFGKDCLKYPIDSFEKGDSPRIYEGLISPHPSAFSAC